MKHTITVIIPTKNEGQGLRQIIHSVKPYATEILVVDGHSTDNTKEIAKKEEVRYLLDHGIGRGDGVRMGIAKATSDIIVFFDADGSHEASDIPRLIEPISKGKADMVIASRRTGGSFDMNMNVTGLIRSVGSDVLVMLVNYALKTNLTDILYSFRAVKTSVAKKLELRANDFCIEQEMVVKCIKKKYKLIEIPSREKARAWGKSKLQTITGIRFIIKLLQELSLS